MQGKEFRQSPNFSEKENKEDQECEETICYKAMKINSSPDDPDLIELYRTSQIV